jgi:hypothetical protein
MRAFLIALCVTATMGYSERAQSTPDPAAPSLVGWWRSEALCLELFANGDFELSIMGSEPKIQVLGSASVAADRSAVTLNVKRIWRARYVSRCRKTHEIGDWIDAVDVLGVTFAPKGTVKLALRPFRDGQIEVCAKGCATLKLEKSALLGRWRRDGFQNASKPEITWAKGEVVELNLDPTDYMCHVWIGSGPRTYDEIPGVGKARYLDPDRFAVTLIAEADKSAHEYTARRLADEHLEVCDKAGHCSTLERQFDSYHYTLY